MHLLELYEMLLKEKETSKNQGLRRSGSRGTQEYKHQGLVHSDFGVTPVTA